MARCSCGFLGQPVKIVAGLVAFPGDIAEGPEQRLQPADLLGQKGVAARVGDQVVQPAVDRAGLLDEARAGARPLARSSAAESSARACSSARSMRPQAVARRLALQGAADLADLADLVRRDAPHDGPAIGQQIDDADAGQRDECLADRRVTDAEAFGQLLRDQVLAGAQPALEDVGQERLHDGLAAQAVIARRRIGVTRNGHSGLLPRSLWLRIGAKVGRASKYYRLEDKEDGSQLTG